MRLRRRPGDKHGVAVMEKAGEAHAWGMLSYAENYRLAGALVLKHGGAENIRLHSPSRFLFKHCIELCFKAYLRKKGQSDKQLRKYGHDSVALAKAAIAEGMIADQYDLSVIFDLLSEEDPIDDRYLRPGMRAEVRPDVLAQIAERLTTATQDNIAAVEMMETMLDKEV
jgi:hypothetical protein